MCFGFHTFQENNLSNIVECPGCIKDTDIPVDAAVFEVIRSSIAPDIPAFKGDHLMYLKWICLALWKPKKNQDCIITNIFEIENIVLMLKTLAIDIDFNARHFTLVFNTDKGMEAWPAIANTLSESKKELQAINIFQIIFS